MPPSPIRSRAWQSPEDTRRIQDLVRDRLARDWPAVRFHPGDIDWWVVGTHGRSPGMTERVRLWFADGPGQDPGRPIHDDATPLAYGWFGPPTDLDFVIGPDDPDVVAPLTAEIVAWADERRRTFAEGAIGPLRAWVSAADGAGTASLAALGLEPEDKPGFVHFTGNLAMADDWPAPSLLRGLTVRPLTSEADIAARVECGHAAFPGSTQTIERYRTVSEAWLYRRDLDRLIVTDDGRVVAFALGWFDPATRVVELEPVGVHPEWHRRGLGREICRATLRAARDLGAERAMIASDRANAAAMALYASLGLTITADIVPYARPLEAGVTEPAAARA
jgi:ribosomal protein S18 acetylase RimI-like enzyme